MEMFRDLTPLVEPRSLDEAYLDLTGCEALHGPVLKLARDLKDRIHAELEITASVGIATNKLVAKIASDFKKPNGLVDVPAGNEASFLAPLPVRALPGVGPATARGLQDLGIIRVADLAATPVSVLRSRFGSLASHLLRMARGIDDSPVEQFGEAKSISRSITFGTDTLDYAFLRAVVGCLVERVGARLRDRGRAARTVHLQVRFADFETITRSATLATPADSDDILFAEALRLLDHSICGKRVRLVGVGVSGLGPLAFQPSLLGQDESGLRLDRCLDAIRARHGSRSVMRGRTLMVGRPGAGGGNDCSGPPVPNKRTLLPAVAEALGQRLGKP